MCGRAACPRTRSLALFVGALAACQPASLEARRSAFGRRDAPHAAGAAASRLRGGSDAVSFQQQYWIPLESSPEVRAPRPLARARRRPCLRPARVSSTPRPLPLPLPRPPQVFNDFVRRVGVQGGWAFTDVLGLDEELLAMVPQPCIAVVLLFPVSQQLAASEAARARIGGARPSSPRVFFMRQYVGNACGTVAAMHALMNNREQLTVGSGPLRELMGPAEPAGANAGAESSGGGAGAERLGERLSSSAGLMQASETSARLGGTPAPARGVDADYHYVCFIRSAHDGCLYELDGTKPAPINHGPVPDAGSGGLLRGAARVIREHFVAQMPDGHFNVMALVADPDGSLALARD